MGRVRAPRRPTPAHIGSRDKVKALAERAANGEELFHPADEPTAKQGATLRQGNGGRHVGEEPRQTEPSRHVFREPASHDME
jgi:hypothetical protein